MNITIPEVILRDNNPYTNGFINVAGDDLLLISEPFKYIKSPNDRYYTVEQGDTLTLIAQAAYEDSKEWKRIADANNILNPLILTPGISLLIPDLSTSKVVNTL